MVAWLTRTDILFHMNGIDVTWVIPQRLSGRVFGVWAELPQEVISAVKLALQGAFALNELAASRVR